MRGQMNVNKDSKQMYMPRNLVRDGFVGKIDTISSFNTVVLLRPGSMIDDQLESLEVVMHDLRMRKKAEENEKNNIGGT